MNECACLYLIDWKFIYRVILMVRNHQLFIIQILIRHRKVLITSWSGRELVFRKFCVPVWSIRFIDYYVLWGSIL